MVYGYDSVDTFLTAGVDGIEAEARKLSTEFHEMRCVSHRSFSETSSCIASILLVCVS
jgi:hypothetical protein